MGRVLMTGGGGGADLDVITAEADDILSGKVIVDKDGNPKFTLKLLDDEYLLLGDDRIVSKDSRQVGAFKKEQIKGQAVFRLWPIYPFKTY